jgi:hypothetical protein
MRVFHRTSHEAAAAILARGFRDATARWGTDEDFTGVWVTSERPWDPAVAALGIVGQKDPGALLVIDAHVAELAEYEWVQEDIGYREALVPAAVLNRHPVWEAWQCDGDPTHIAPAGSAGWEREPHPPFGIIITVCPNCRDD